MNFKILDCTLRDGGYYTNWDFENDIVENYLSSMNELPIEYLEVGYRSIPLEGYLGEYFYLPLETLKRLKEKSNKRLVVILNEKDIRVEHVDELLSPCKPYITMVRLAIDPANFERALELAKAVKDLGFEVGFNVMYMSNWEQYPEMWELLPKVNGLVSYFYMVDSFGGVYPEDVKRITEKLKLATNVTLGFHGHNNLELALINTLTAIDSGVEIVDATITGMGRGAGNLKTELLLTALNAKNKLEVNYNALSKTVDDFSSMQKHYEWGSNLPYMVSGANSLPQKQVMEWVSKRFYSFNSIIRALNLKKDQKIDNEKFSILKKINTYKNAVIIGGGPSTVSHRLAIETYIEKNISDTCLILASSKYAKYFFNAKIEKFYCLVGNESERIKSAFDFENDFNGTCVLPPYPRKMGTSVPDFLHERTMELEKIAFTSENVEAQTAVAIETAITLGAQQLYFIGYDGYQGASVSQKDQELFIENTQLFADAQNKLNCFSLTPTKYKSLRQMSIYSEL